MCGTMCNQQAKFTRVTSPQTIAPISALGALMQKRGCLEGLGAVGATSPFTKSVGVGAGWGWAGVGAAAWVCGVVGWAAAPPGVRCGRDNNPRAPTGPHWAMSRQPPLTAHLLPPLRPPLWVGSSCGVLMLG